MFNTNHSTPLSSPTLSSPSQPLGAGPTLGSAPFLPSPTAAAPPLHATYLAPGATDMDMLIDQPSAAAADDVMMTDDRIVADDDPMTGGGAESDSEMMIDDHDIGGPGAATPMSVSMGGESADVDVEMVASEMTYNVAGGVVGVPVAEHLQQQQQQFAFEAQCVQHQPGFAAAPAQLAQEVYFMQDAALSGGPQEQKPAQEQEQLVLPSDLPPTSVVEEDLLDYVEEQLVEELELEQVGGQVESAVTEPQAVSVADPSVPTLVDVAAPYTIEPEAPLSATAQSSPHSHPHDPEADDSQDHADADEYYDDADAYYDEDHDGEMPHITLTYNGVTYAVFPPLAVAEQENAAVTTSSSSPSSPSYPPLFPSADESELGSIRDGTINDFMWRVKERFELGEDMDVALKYMNLDGIMIREETAIGYDNQFDSFWSLYMALYPGATDPLHIEVVAELSAAAKLDMLLYRAQYADESEAGVESTSSSPSPQLPVDAGAVVDESKPVAVETPGLPQRQVELAAALQGVAGKLDDGAGQDEQHVEEVAEEGVEVAERDLDFQEPVPNQAQEPETDTHQQQPQLQQEQAIGTQQDHKYVDDYPADFEGAQHQAVVPTEEATNDDVAHVDGVQEHFGDEHHTTDSSAQGQQPTAEAGVLESELSQAPELNLANPDTYEPAVSEPASIAAPEQQPQPSVHQHLTSEEFLDWVEDEAVNEPVPEHGLIDNSAGDDTPVPPVSLNDHDSSASSSSPIVGHGQSSSHAAPSTGIPPSPAPTVDPLVPAPSSAPASRPSSPVADSAAGMVGDPLVAGGTTAPAATNGAMKRSLEVMDTNDFDPCDEPKTNTPYKRQRTSDERN